MLKLKFQYFGHLMRRAVSLEKTLMLGKVEGWRSYLTPPRWRPGVEARRANSMPEARDSGREDQTHVQGAVAVWVQEGLLE